MALGFQNSGLLWLTAAAAAAPFVAHLVARTRPPERRFPTVEFLRRAMRRVWRLRRPRDLFLLALRTIAIATLALAFARPLWLSGEAAAGGSDAKHLMLVVDRSGSMAAVSGGQSRFSLAKARAVEALQGAGRLDSVNLVWIDAAPDAVYPRMGRSSAPLEAALNEAEVSGESGAAAAALRLALDRLTEMEGTKELIAISDFQAETWEGALPDLPPTVRVLTLPVGGPAGNLALAGIELEPPTPLAGESIQVLGRLRNFSAERRTARVAITAGEARHVREVEIDAWSEGQFVVETPTPEGADEFPVKAAIEGADDALRPDDMRWAVAKHRAPLRVALALPPGSVSDAERDVWRRLLRSLPWTRETDDTAKAEVLIASGASPEIEASARAVLAAGGAVIYRPAATGAQLGSWFEVFAGQWESRSTEEEGWRLKIARETDALFKLFALGEYGDPAAGRTRDRWRAPIVEGALMAYDDGVPAIWRGEADGGTLWWWNLPLDPARSTWPVQPAFLPLIGEALLLSRPRETPPQHAQLAPGQHARWEPDLFPEGGAVVLLDAENRALPLAEDAAAGSLAYRTASPLQPGAYRWALRDAELDRDVALAHTVVNFPESEMDGRAIDAPVIETWAKSRAPGGYGRSLDWSALRDGLPLWPWCVGLALALFGLEAVILSFDRRSVKTAPIPVG